MVQPWNHTINTIRIAQRLSPERPLLEQLLRTCVPQFQNRPCPPTLQFSYTPYVYPNTS